MAHCINLHNLLCPVWIYGNCSHTHISLVHLSPLILPYKWRPFIHLCVFAVLLWCPAYFPIRKFIKLSVVVLVLPKLETTGTKFGSFWQQFKGWCLGEDGRRRNKHSVHCHLSRVKEHGPARKDSMIWVEAKKEIPLPRAALGYPGCASAAPPASLPQGCMSERKWHLS